MEFQSGSSRPPLRSTSCDPRASWGKDLWPGRRCGAKGFRHDAQRILRQGSISCDIVPRYWQWGRSQRRGVLMVGPSSLSASVFIPRRAECSIPCLVRSRSDVLSLRRSVLGLLLGPRGHSPDHRHDASLQGLGQVGPGIDHGGQVGVILAHDGPGDYPRSSLWPL